MNEEISSLDELFSEAKQHIIAGRQEAAAASRATRRTPIKEPAPLPDTLYTNPENWKAGRGIALLHEESDTLLGNFQEWLHLKDSGARKLVRVEGPIVVSCTEYVEGDWWLAKELEIAAPESWHERRQAVVHLHMPSMGVHSPGCAVHVCLSYGAIARVELEFATTFAQLDGSPAQLLQLPAGVNVLPMLSQDCKVAVRIEVGV